MQKKIIKLLTICSSVTLLCITPLCSEAADLTMRSARAAVVTSEDVTVTVHIENNTEDVNAYSGAIILPTGARITSLNADVGVVNSWINRPTPNGQIISFDGITLGGFKGAEGTLFSFDVVFESVGQKTFQWSNAAVLKNDGQGTNVLQTTRGINMNASKGNGTVGTNEKLVDIGNQEDVEVIELASSDSVLDKDVDTKVAKNFLTSNLLGSPSFSEMYAVDNSSILSVIISAVVALLILAALILLLHVIVKKIRPDTKPKTYTEAFKDTFTFKVFTKRSFLIPVVAMLMAVISYVAITNYTASAWISFKFQKNEEVVMELYKKQKTSELAVQDLLSDSEAITALIDRDETRLQMILNHFKEKYELKLLMAVSDKGRALVRTQNTSYQNDYIFQTTPYGSELEKGKSVNQYVRGKIQPLLFVTGAPHLVDEKVQGAFVAAFALNQETFDGFAETVSSELLLSLNGSVLASTFDRDPVLHQKMELLLSRFDEDDTNADLHGEFIIEGDTYGFSTHRLSLVGVSDTALVVSVMKKPWWFSNEVASIITVSLFVLLVALGFMIIKKYSWRYQVFFMGVYVSSALLVIIIATMHFKAADGSNVYDNNLFSIYNSNFYLTPESDVVTPGTTQKLNIMLESGGEEISAIYAHLLFNENGVEITNILSANEICQDSFVIENKVFDEKISYACLIPGGYTGNGGVLATIEYVIKPGQEGIFDFSSDSRVLANDGLATNVLRGTSSASIRSFEESNDNIFIFSSTHPNINKWYDQSQVKLAWTATDAEAYQVIVVKKQIDPDWSKAETVETESYITTLGESGEYVAYVRDAEGLTNSFPFKVDINKPSISQVLVSNENAKVGELVRMLFDASDVDSGLQSSNFYVSYDDGIYFPVTSPFYTSFSKKGSQNLKFRVYDKAGNYSERTIIMQIK